MTSAIAIRKTMHGPLWTVERGPTRIQLWAPNDQRDHWALAWTTTDKDGETIEAEYLKASALTDIPALTPSHMQRLAGAALNAASAWNPAEDCDHTRATSFGLLDDERFVCGYCGRTFDGPLPR